MRVHQGQQDGKLQVYERDVYVTCGWLWILHKSFFLHGRESFQLHIQVTSDERLV